jgi:protoheme IX farnesyltransferase
MLPVTHGLTETRRQILGYSLALVACTLVPLPGITGLAGWGYGLTAIVLGAVFLALAWKVFRSTATTAPEMLAEKRLFKFSLLYLAILFGALVADVWLS